MTGAGPIGAMVTNDWCITFGQFSGLRGWNKSQTIYGRIRVSTHVYTVLPIQVSDCQRQFIIHYYEPVHDKTSKLMCTQRRLRSAWASAQSDQSLLTAWRKIGSITTLWAHREDSDQTGRMPRLIWIFAGCTGHFVGLSCSGPYKSHVTSKPVFRFATS